MKQPIRYLLTGGQREIEEKRSRFIATIAPATTEEEANAFIEAQKKRYWDARHNCSALVLGDNAEITRCNDDGEPPHTAGRPMLDILLREEVRDICVVVTRYFGGILLGTGGLVRAYQEAVRAGLEACVIATRQEAVPITVRTDYTGIGAILRLIAERDIPTLSTDYAELVTVTLLAPADDCEPLRSAILDLTQGKAVCELGDPVRYTRSGRDVTLL